MGHDIDGLVQERRYSIANALEFCFSCTDPSIYFLHRSQCIPVAMSSLVCPSQRPGDVDLWCLLCCWPKQAVKQTIKLLCDLRLHKCLPVFSSCVGCLGSDLIMGHCGRNGWHLISTAWKAGGLISLWLSVQLYGWVLGWVLLDMRSHLYQMEGIIY